MERAGSADVAVIGAGPAGLMAAETIAQAGLRVRVFDRMPSAGRKLLMAGRGGLNLTHSEPLPQFLSRYREAQAALAPLIAAFTPGSLRAWCEELGQPTFVGSSGRVFPQAFKASPLLRAWLRRLDRQGVSLALRHRWSGWDDDGALRFETPGGSVMVAPRATLLALGGASWPKLGSDGSWQVLLAGRGVSIAPLRPANCGFSVDWSQHLRERFAGTPLKNVVLSAAGESVRGEAMLTGDGIEGGAVYALSAPLREAIAASGAATLAIDLRPDLDAAQIAERLGAARRGQSLASTLRKKLALPPVAIALLHETAGDAPLSSRDAPALAARIKAVPLRLTGTAPVARAISTAGGIRMDELDDALMLRRLPGMFVAGEMLDWEAPTGGYLLQASFATGHAAGRGVVDWLKR
jgi:uncharacterized flavoprotein (TIGR03862 family)